MPLSVRTAPMDSNRAKRQGLTAAGREKLRQQALLCQPWRQATGPRTPEGKARAAQNGTVRQTGVVSRRTLARELGALQRLLRDMASTQRLLHAENGIGRPTGL
jgi:hypothetical protein